MQEHQNKIRTATLSITDNNKITNDFSKTISIVYMKLEIEDKDTKLTANDFKLACPPPL